jgi:hypothetical protein
VKIGAGPRRRAFKKFRADLLRTAQRFKPVFAEAGRGAFFAGGRR